VLEPVKADERGVPADPAADRFSEGEAIADENPLTPMTAMATKLCIIVARMFLRRTSPA